MKPFEGGKYTYRTPMMTPLEFAGHLLIDRGYVFPSDFTGDNAVDKAAWEVINFLEAAAQKVVPARLTLRTPKERN